VNLASSSRYRPREDDVLFGASLGHDVPHPAEIGRGVLRPYKDQAGVRHCCQQAGQGLGQDKLVLVGGHAPNMKDEWLFGGTVSLFDRDTGSLRFEPEVVHSHGHHRGDTRRTEIAGPMLCHQLAEANHCIGLRF
jgi:hypothetical protein